MQGHCRARMNGRKNGTWNKCTGPQCRECEESQVIYGVGLGAPIDRQTRLRRRRRQRRRRRRRPLDAPTPSGDLPSLVPIIDSPDFHKSQFVNSLVAESPPGDPKKEKKTRTFPLEIRVPRALFVNYVLLTKSNPPNSPVNDSSKKRAPCQSFGSERSPDRKH